MTIRISLTETDFDALVGGKPVYQHGVERVEIILKDIGWRRMLDAIENAMPPGERAFHRRVRRTIDDAAEHGQILTWEQAVEHVTRRLSSGGSTPRRSEGARAAWETRRTVDDYMRAHPGISREDALAAIRGNRE